MWPLSWSSIRGAVLVTHNLTQSKKNDVQPDLIFNVSCVHTNSDMTDKLELRGKENSILTRDLSLLKSFTKKWVELGFWVIRVTGYRTTEWFFPSQLIFNSREGTRELRRRKKPELLHFPQGKYSHWLDIRNKCSGNSGHCDKWSGLFFGAS